MTYLRAGIKPDWIGKADRAVNVSDMWMEATDPQNERGEVCMAYLASTVPLTHYPMEGGPDPRDGMELLGISIEDTTGTIYRNRAWAQKVLGVDAVWKIEQHEMETA